MPGVIDGIDEVGGVLDGLAVSWVDDLSDDALLGSLAAVERHRRVLDATVMHLVAEADARSVSDRTAGLATSTWISREGRQSFGAARRKVIVARALAERFDEVDAAMVKGEIGFEHAWVIVNATHPRIADAMEAIQDRLLRLTSGRTFTAWRREVERIAALLDDRPSAERDADVGSNRLSFGRDPDGSVSLRGRFVGSWAETIEHVLPTIADQLLRGFQADHAACPELVVPDRESVMALAFEEACRRAMACDSATATAPSTDATIIIPIGPPPDPIDPIDPNRTAPPWFTGLTALDTGLDIRSLAGGSAVGATSIDPVRLPDWFPTGSCLQRRWPSRRRRRRPLAGVRPGAPCRHRRHAGSPARRRDIDQVRDTSTPTWCAHEGWRLRLPGM